jgi:PAS domain S-box-containing protein
MMGRYLIEVTPSEELVARAQEIMSELLDGRSWSGEFTVRRKDDTTFPAMVTSAPVHDEQGHLVAIIGVSIDITEIKQTGELRRSEERFRLLAENVQDLIFRFRFKPTPTFEYVSPSSTSIIGYTPEEHYADPELGLSIVHPDDRHLIDEVFGYPESPVVIRWLHKDGQVIWTEQHNKPIYDEAGELVAIEGISRDISGRMEAEEALREAEGRYRTLVEQIPFATYVQEIEHNNATVYMSPQIEDMLGYSSREYTDDSGLWLNVLYPEDCGRVLAEDARTDETGEPFRMEYRMIRRDGGVVWVQDEALLVRDAAGNPLSWQGVMLDVTERKRAEEQLQYQTFHDLLTDLPNRRLFVDRLEQALRRIGRRRGGARWRCST